VIAGKFSVGLATCCSFFRGTQPPPSDQRESDMRALARLVSLLLRNALRTSRFQQQ